MNNRGLSPTARFIKTLDIVWREGQHLAYSWRNLSVETIDTDWVIALAEYPQTAERLEAFVSRFSRMQDTIADKLLPRWLLAAEERPGSQIETLNRAERLGVLMDTQNWLEARKLRNQLVHEYIENAEEFAEALQLALHYSLMLIDTYNRVHDFAVQRLGMNSMDLPPKLDLPS
ncbi:MAG: hypothetical protein EPN21_03695 [Methylococcaceae bacterium]|nr:MAG: hypothetical protein EPN21_03695 [Methylococcaceae bacterium]